MSLYACSRCKWGVLRRFEDCEVAWCKKHDMACQYVAPTDCDDDPPIGGGKWWVGHGAGYLTTEPEPVGINPRVFVGVPVFTPEQQRQFEEHVHQIAVERFKRKFGLSPPPHPI